MNDTNHTQTLDAQDELAQIEAFERHYGYDATYMKEMLETNPQALAVFNAFIPMVGYRQHAPLEGYFVAKITAFRHADCGPCYQLAVQTAQEAGLSRPLLQALVENRELPERLDLVRRFTLAVLTASDDSERLRQQVKQALGAAALTEIALVIAGAQVFPTVKRALGHFKSCSLVSVTL